MSNYLMIVNYKMGLRRINKRILFLNIFFIFNGLFAFNSLSVNSSDITAKNSNI